MPLRQRVSLLVSSGRLLMSRRACISHVRLVSEICTACQKLLTLELQGPRERCLKVLLHACGAALTEGETSEFIDAAEKRDGTEVNGSEQR